MLVLYQVDDWGFFKAIDNLVHTLAAIPTKINGFLNKKPTGTPEEIAAANATTAAAVETTEATTAAAAVATETTTAEVTIAPATTEAAPAPEVAATTTPAAAPEATVAV